MPRSIRWEVSPKPTGLYRSFHRRGWPIGFHKETGQRVLIRCAEEYSPKAVREGTHPPLTVCIDIWDKDNGGLKLVILHAKPETLKDAKDLAEKFFKQRPEFVKPN